MIPFPGDDLLRPVQLLQQHHPGQLVRERHFAHGHLFVRARQYVLPQPETPADHKNDPARAADPQLLQVRRQRRGIRLFPGDRQGDHPVSRADPAAEGSQDELLLRHTEKRESSIPVVKKKRSKYATCVVTNGQGIIDIFREMGADEILVGGQGKNPSAQDFMDCFDRLNADAIFVFPNNANIVMAAEQAAGMYKDSRVFVIPSKSLGQAYTAMSMLDISFDTAEEVRDNFIANMEYAETGMVCKACREYESMEFTVSEDDYLGVSRNQLMSASADKVEALGVLCDKMGIEDRGIATVIYGESITDEDRDKTRRLFAEKWKDKEFYEIEGQQELYDLIVILE